MLNNTIFSRGIPFPNSNDINPLIRSKLKDDLKGMHQYCNAKDRRPFKGTHVKVRIKSIALCFTQVIKQLISIIKQLTFQELRSQLLNLYLFVIHINSKRNWSHP